MKKDKLEETKTRSFLNKILSLLLVNTILVSLFAPYSIVFASNTMSVRLENDATTLNVNDEVNIKFYIENESLAGMQGFLVYDTEIFEPIVKRDFSLSEELDSGEYGNWTINYTESNNNYFRVVEDEGNAYQIPSGHIATLTLRVKKTVDTAEIAYRTIEIDGATDIDGDAGYHEIEEIKTTLPNPVSTHTVTYNYAENGGTSTTASETPINVAEGAKLDLTPTAQKEGYVFEGWNTNKDAKVALTNTDELATMGTEDVTLYAIFSKEITATCHYYDSNAQKQTNQLKQKMFNKETEVTIQLQTVANYTDANSKTWTKKGWTTQASVTPSVEPIEETANVTISENTDYYMVYERDINVVYSVNGATTLPPTNPTGLKVTTNASNINAVQGAEVTITSTIPVKEGYTFQNSWNTEANGTGTSYASNTLYTFTDDATLYAKWEANNDTPYKVEHYKEQPDGTYKLTDTDKKTGKTGLTAVAEAKTTYEGYTLTTTEDTKASGIITGDGNLVLKLYYKANTDTEYKIEHYKEQEDGTYILEETETEQGATGFTATATPKTTYVGYTETETANTLRSAPITGDGKLVLKLYYKINEYTVNFKNEDNSLIEAQTVKHGKDAEEPETEPTKEQTIEHVYEFIGWVDDQGHDVDLTNITKDMDVYPKFEEKARQYTITFYAEDKTTQLDSQTVDYGTKATYAGEEPTKESTVEHTYEFIGWVDSENNDVDLNNITENKNVYPKFEESARKYKITFYDEDKTTKLGESEVEYGLDATYPNETPVKQGIPGHIYVFDKWVDDTGAEDDLSNVVANRNVYATYTDELATSIVTLDVNGGDELEASDSTKNVTYGEPYGELPTPTRTGYNFVGWFDKQENGQGNEITKETTVTQTKNHRIYAHWEIKRYTVEFIGKTNDGTPEGTDAPLKTLQVEHGVTMTESIYGDLEALKQPVVTPKYTYTVNLTTPFTGDLTSPVVADRQIQINYNTPTINSYKVVFYNDDKTTKIGEVSVQYGQTADDTDINPQKDDNTYTYTFSQWVDNEGNPDNLSNVIANRNVYATYTTTYKNYEIKFVDEDGTTIISQKTDYHYGDNITLPETNPEKEGTDEYTYEFAGWVDVEDTTQTVVDLTTVTVSRNATYKAKYTRNKK